RAEDHARARHSAIGLRIVLGYLRRASRPASGRYRTALPHFQLWRHEAGLGSDHFGGTGKLFATRLDFPVSERGGKPLDPWRDSRFRSKAQTKSQGTRSARRWFTAETLLPRRGPDRGDAVHYRPCARAFELF